MPFGVYMARDTSHTVGILSRAIGVCRGIVASLKTRDVTHRALAVPVHAAARPMSPISSGSFAILRVKPFLLVYIPGRLVCLVPAVVCGDEILDQWVHTDRCRCDVSVGKACVLQPHIPRWV